MRASALSLSSQSFSRAAHKLRLMSLAALLGVMLNAPVLAQTSPAADTVTWTLAPQATDKVKQGGRLSLELRGEVLDGWHVYAIEQFPGGPIPLRVTLEPGDIATADGAQTPSPSTKAHDPSFNLDTQYYAKPFTITLPVRIAAGAAPGPQQIPVSVLFQTCNGKTCKPPKTVKLSAAVNVLKAG